MTNGDIYPGRLSGLSARLVAELSESAIPIVRQRSARPEVPYVEEGTDLIKYLDLASTQGWSVSQIDLMANAIDPIIVYLDQLPRDVATSSRHAVLIGRVVPGATAFEVRGHGVNIREFGEYALRNTRDTLKDEGWEVISDGGTDANIFLIFLRRSAI
jgi:hypothetical protein